MAAIMVSATIAGGAGARVGARGAAGNDQWARVRGEPSMGRGGIARQ